MALFGLVSETVPVLATSSTGQTEGRGGAGLFAEKALDEQTYAARCGGRPVATCGAQKTTKKAGVLPDPRSSAPTAMDSETP